ncbi:MAG TPA: putative zinc-binding metallopeptidase, partial [Planctomycetaceae bacterium]|nr:putative zinc-binding metallopeptidase [Planctomycetaceae bacterium]
FCVSCRLTHFIPDLSKPGHREAWYALEVAKRRLVYSLVALGLPLAPKSDDCPRGLAFEFQSDESETAPVLTGHSEGVITINIAEADDAEREKRRLLMHEPYRTLLGHFRHEVGHYYWDRLIRDRDGLDGFRALFGDERESYPQSLERHYQQGPVPDWQKAYVSAYASAHPWEDWAETWAHYLHITDTLETAGDCGLALRPRHADLPAVRPRFSLRGVTAIPFDSLLADWLAVAFLLNNLSRGLGEGDLYPFILSEKAIEKLRFVHRVCREPAAPQSPPS